MPEVIMVVDDDSEFRFPVKMILEQSGYKVIEAKNGWEALKTLEKTKPDLILLDVMMPGINGWEVCSMIKKEEATKDIPVAMLTTKGADGDKFYSLGKYRADWHISKPVTKKMLTENVKWLLENSKKKKNLKEKRKKK
jgi:two-component system alkaline phosphatase synthesis response regulator PhoP